MVLQLLTISDNHVYFIAIMEKLRKEKGKKSFLKWKKDALQEDRQGILCSVYQLSSKKYMRNNQPKIIWTQV